MKQEKVWDSIAVEWKDYRTKVPPTVEKFLEGKKGKILDMGCGSGRNIMKLPEVQWYGCDFSSEMLKYAKDFVDKKKIDAELVKCESDDLPYEDNFFDAVLCFAVIHCVDTAKKRKGTIEEIYRVLKPNATALISSWGPKSPKLRTKEKECFVTWSEREGKKINRYTYVYDLDELVELCKKTGFEIVNSWEERNVNVIVRKPKKL